jgi:hypothetical protein
MWRQGNVDLSLPGPFCSRSLRDSTRLLRSLRLWMLEVMSLGWEVGEVPVSPRLAAVS